MCNMQHIMLHERNEANSLPNKGSPRGSRSTQFSIETHTHTHVNKKMLCKCKFYRIFSVTFLFPLFFCLAWQKFIRSIRRQTATYRELFSWFSRHFWGRAAKAVAPTATATWIIAIVVSARNVSLICGFLSTSTSTSTCTSSFSLIFTLLYAGQHGVWSWLTIIVTHTSCWHSVFQQRWTFWTPYR